MMSWLIALLPCLAKKKVGEFLEKNLEVLLTSGKWMAEHEKLLDDSKRVKTDEERRAIVKRLRDHLIK